MNCSQATVWSLQCARLEDNKCAFRGLTISTKGEVSCLPEDQVQGEMPAAQVSELEKGLKQFAHLKVADFDDHLQDVAKDWSNPGLIVLVN